MPTLHQYNVLLNGRFATTVKLTEDDAKARGLTAKDRVGAPGAGSGAGAGAADPASAKRRRSPSNKAATAENKAPDPTDAPPAADPPSDPAEGHDRGF